MAKQFLKYRIDTTISQEKYMCTVLCKHLCAKEKSFYNCKYSIFLMNANRIRKHYKIDVRE